MPTSKAPALPVLFALPILFALQLKHGSSLKTSQDSASKLLQELEELKQARTKVCGFGPCRHSFQLVGPCCDILVPLHCLGHADVCVQLQSRVTELEDVQDELERTARQQEMSIQQLEVQHTHFDGP